MMNATFAYPHLECRIDEATKQLALAELRLRQRRLGTDEERPDDHQRVCDLAHFINNLLTLDTLMASR